MRRIRPFLIVALLTCWLPATVHCALEAAELMDVTCCSEDVHPVAPHETSDHCNGWEENLATSGDALVVKAPDLAVCLCHLCSASALVVPLEPSTVPQPRTETAPPDITSWQFERRAAWPAQAPSWA